MLLVNTRDRIEGGAFMHQQLSKQAGIKASNFDDLVGNLKKLQQQGKNFKSHTDPEDLARYIMYQKGGSGSLFLDASNALLNKASGKRRLGDTVKRKLSNAQRKLTDVDIRAGNKVHNALSKNKATQGVSKAFLYDHKVPLKANPSGVADEIVRVAVPSLTAPIERTKGAVLPMAGALYVNSKIVDAQGGKNKGGDMLKESAYRQMLREKIAATLGDSTEKSATTTRDIDESAKLLKKASYALKVAANKQEKMKEDMIKLANENRQLNTELFMVKKAEDAEDVALMMMNKGLIKKADVHSKIENLIDLDEDAFLMFKEAIINVQPEEKIAGGIDSLTFLAESNNIDGRKTLADSLEEAAGELNKW